jgi:hypothetical protein
MYFDRLQRGTGSKYGSLFDLRFYGVLIYMSHGCKKDGFQFTIQRAQLKLQGWSGVKVADQVAIWNELISDFDSVIRDFNVQKVSMEKGIVHTFVTPNSQWRNPAESSMEKRCRNALWLCYVMLVTRRICVSAA